MFLFVKLELFVKSKGYVVSKTLFNNEVGYFSERKPVFLSLQGQGINTCVLFSLVDK